MPRGAAAQAGVEFNPYGDSAALGIQRFSAGRAMRMRAQMSRSQKRCGRTKGASGGRQALLSGASGLQGGAPRVPGRMQVARRIALLAHDALLSRRRAVPVDVSGEVVHRASVRHGHAATAPNNPIRRRRIEFNNEFQRTEAPVTACAGHRPPTQAHAAPGPSLRSGTLRSLNSRR